VKFLRQENDKAIFEVGLENYKLPQKPGVEKW